MASTGPQKIVFVTGNKGKLAEVQHYIAGVPDVEVVAMKLDLTEVQGASVKEVSRRKAIEAYRIVNQIDAKRTGSVSDARDHVPVLVDDTGLSFDALNGMPGPYIKWFLEAVGPSGLVQMTDGFASPGTTSASSSGATDAVAAHRLASATCVLSYCRGLPDGSGEGEGSVVVEQFEGVARGVLKEPAATSLFGFGWDPIFAPQEQATPYARTYAEMDLEEKNRISHRAKALGLFREYLSLHGSS